ncbi:hypothetical protein K9N50_01585 [bacterium]|nr:hypothetical protein [bacterium]
MKLTYISLALILLLTGFAILGCEEDSPTSPGLPKNLISFGFNNYWIYNSESFENDSLRYRNVDTLTIKDEVLIWGSSEWMQYQGNTNVYWRNGVDGVWRLIINNEYPFGIADRYYSYPTAAGEIWYAASTDDTIRVVSIAETVEVPAGLFEDCYYYQIVSSDDRSRISVWVKPGVGIVQQSNLRFANNDTLRTTSLLKEYYGSN